MELSTNVSLSVIYVACALILNDSMKRRKEAFSLKYLTVLYNVIQIIINMYMVYGLCEPYIQLTNPFLFNISNTKSQEHFMFIHMLSKLIDFMDTFIIILKKKSEKQLTFLHLYHHSTIGIIWCYLIVNKYAFGSITFGALLNSFVHCIMYTHYLILSLKLKNPFKKYVTIIQIIQFMLCILHSILFPIFETVNNGPWQLQLFYQTTMMILFLNFSKKAYGKKKV